MVNRDPGKCSICSYNVPAGTGRAERAGARWKVTHMACAEFGGPHPDMRDLPAHGQVVSFYSPVTGKSWTRNARGLCEDAPCCGCCTG